VGRPLWREVGSVVFGCFWASSADSFSGLSPAGLWLQLKFKFKLYSERRSVGQFVLVSGPLWGPWSDFNFLCLATTFFLLHVGCPLWREDGSVICSAITHWLESHKTHNHRLMSHLRLPQPGGPGPFIYMPQEQSGPVIPPGTGFPFRRLLRFARLRRRYSNPPLRRVFKVFKIKVKVMLRLTVGQSVSMSWCLVYSETCDPILFAFWKLLYCLCGASILTRGRVCLLLD
jgi:hypothetical protein